LETLKWQSNTEGEQFHLQMLFLSLGLHSKVQFICFVFVLRGLNILTRIKVKNDANRKKAFFMESLNTLIRSTVTKMSGNWSQIRKIKLHKKKKREDAQYKNSRENNALKITIFIFNLLLICFLVEKLKYFFSRQNNSLKGYLWLKKGSFRNPLK
jgi:hypothetical protein